jgi:DNA-binding LacI/PurR family transcriptional regulator
MMDVARLAGVSHQTVSRVINGSDHIRPATRERVLEAIRDLGYRPNHAARALVRGRTGILGVITTSATLYGPTSIEHAIEEAARADGLLVTSIALSTVTPEAFRDAVDHLLRVGVEGIVVIAGYDDALGVVRQSAVGIPLVVVEGDLSRARHTVGVDQHEGARLATEHLLDLGHREIVHVGGPQDWAEARARAEGWRRALTRAGTTVPEVLVGDWSSASGYEAGLRIAEIGTATAVFVANDQMAIGLLLALHERGVSVPGQVSVVGFDDIPEASFTIPPLTTVRQDFTTVGHRAVDLVSEAMRGTQGRRPRLIAPTLVVRSSTATRATSCARERTSKGKIA